MCVCVYIYTSPTRASSPVPEVLRVLVVGLSPIVMGPPKAGEASSDVRPWLVERQE